MLWKVELHLHTKCSRDSIIDIRKLPKVMKKKNIDKIAITDHNRICFNKIKRVKNWKEFFIIGEEIKTKEGFEIIGLFLNEEIAKGISAIEVVEKIKEQGGIVYLPHPCSFPRFGKNFDDGKEEYREIMKKVDIVEIFNSRNIFNWQNERALKLAEKYKKIKGVGSDAHTYMEIGNSLNIVKPFHSKKEFLKNMKKARFICKKAIPIILSLSPTLRAIYKIKRVKNCFKLSRDNLNLYFF